MTQQTPTTDDLPRSAAATADPQPEKAPAANGPGSAAADAAAGCAVPVTLTSADVAALPRERQETLLSVLPPVVAAILITNRPPQPPHVEYAAHKRLVAALARARNEIPPIPMDRTVDYVSTRTGEHVHYRFASLDAIHKAVTGPLSENGLALECVFNGDVIVVLLSHADGGIHLSWLPLPEPDDIKELGEPDHDAPPLPDGAAHRHLRRRGHRRAQHPGEPPRRAAGPARRTAGSGPQPRAPDRTGPGRGARPHSSRTGAASRRGGPRRGRKGDSPPRHATAATRQPRRPALQRSRRTGSRAPAKPATAPRTSRSGSPTACAP